MSFKNTLPLFYWVLLATLTGDALLSFTSATLVYAHTQDLAMSGLFYCVEWSIRLFLIPFMGRWIDTRGIRHCSIFFDICKIVSCFLFWGATYMIKTNTLLSVTIGVFCSLIALANAQTLIAYEKYIVELDQRQPGHLDKYANCIARADQCAMIIGPLIGFIFFKKSLTVIVCVAICAYASNLYFFLYKRYLAIHKLDTWQADKDIDKAATEGNLLMKIGGLLRTDIALTSVLFVIVVGNFFSNMLDGMVESAGIAVIFEQMHKPVEYYAFVLMVAGGVGVAATAVFSKIYSAKHETLLLLIVVLLEWIAGLGIFVSFHHFVRFVSFYAFCIGSKIIRGVLTRMYRMRKLPSHCFASISSFMTVLGQLSLPVVGLLLYNDKQYNRLPQYTIFICAFIVLLSSIFLLLRWSRAIDNSTASN